MIANEFYLHPYSIAVRTFFRRQPSRYVIYNLGYECQICCVYSDAHIELFIVPGIIYQRQSCSIFTNPAIIFTRFSMLRKRHTIGNLHLISGYFEHVLQFVPPKIYLLLS